MGLFVAILKKGTALLPSVASRAYRPRRKNMHCLIMDSLPWHRLSAWKRLEASSCMTSGTSHNDTSAG